MNKVSKLSVFLAVLIGIALADNDVVNDVPQFVKIGKNDSAYFIDSVGNMVTLQPLKEADGRKVIVSDKNFNIFSFERKKDGDMLVTSTHRNGEFEIVTFDSDGNGLPEKMFKRKGNITTVYEIKHQLIEVKNHGEKAEKQ